MTTFRVLHIADGHPDLTGSGGDATVFAHDLFEGLRADGGMEPMYVGCVGEPQRPLRGEGRLQGLARSADEALLWIGTLDRLMLAQAEGEAAARSLADLLRHFRPHVVHVHRFRRIGLDALMVIRRALPATRIVATLHDYDLVCANDGRLVTAAGMPCGGASADACRRCFPEIFAGQFVARTLHLRNLLGLVDRFVAPNAALRDRFVAWGIARARISVIPYALPERTMSAPSAPERPRRSFGVFGPLTAGAGLLVALRAARLLQDQGIDAALRLHGDVDRQDEAFAVAFDRDLAAVPGVAWYAGPCRRDDLPALMAKVDWVVVPALDPVAAPLAILEAFQQRRPVIGAEVEGVAALVRDGVNGLMFRCGDAADLAWTMRRAIGEGGLWDRLTAGIPPCPSLAESVDRHLALYNALLRADDKLKI